MFRELGFGVCFFVSAMLGMFNGVNCYIPTNRSEAIEAQMQLVWAMFGLIAGGIAWLWWKHRITKPKQSRGPHGKTG